MNVILIMFVWFPNILSLPHFRRNYQLFVPYYDFVKKNQNHSNFGVTYVRQHCVANLYATSGPLIRLFSHRFFILLLTSVTPAFFYGTCKSTIVMINTLHVVTHYFSVHFVKYSPKWKIEINVTHLSALYCLSRTNFQTNLEKIRNFGLLLQRKRIILGRYTTKIIKAKQLLV
jgi:hypothetical protein